MVQKAAAKYPTEGLALASQLKTTASPPLTVADGYDRWADTYDSAANATRDACAIELRSQPLELAGARVLELGCGTGANTVWLAERAAEVIAIDFAPRMLDCARRRATARNINFAAHDINRRLPLDDGVIDVVIETLVLEHVAKLDRLFAEVSRVLRPGGVFMISELHPYRQLMGKQARFLDGETDTELLIEAWPHTITEFVNAILGAGLSLVRVAEHPDDAAGFPRLFSLTATKP